MKKHILFYLLLVPILIGCCSLCPDEREGLLLMPDPAAPSVYNTIEVREMMIDIVNLKLFALQWKIKSIYDRAIVGEITLDEAEAEAAPILEALEKWESHLGDIEETA